MPSTTPARAFTPQTYIGDVYIGVFRPDARLLPSTSAASGADSPLRLRNDA
jgi:hypothetical protein